MDIGEVRSLEGYIYILKSLFNNKYYIGSTNNIQKRLIEHENGYVKATKNIRPLELMFTKKYETLKEARQIEYKLKTYKNRNIIERIIKEKEIKLGL